MGISLTPICVYFCYRAYYWDSNMVSFKIYDAFLRKYFYDATGYISMMARHLTGGVVSCLHTNIVEIGLRWGIILFITSEVIFFISFFWAFFHRSLSPNVELGCLWPPIGVDSFDPFKVPLINTIILLSSGVRVTWAHHALIEGDFTRAQEAFLVTIFLGVYFTAIQLLEYVESSFSISDSSYGRTFFVATGFHGLHVLIGTLFLIFPLLRIMIGKIRASHHFGFEASAWYWHFVDVV